MTDTRSPDDAGLDQRLTDLLARSAAAVEVRPDPEAVRRGDLVVRLTDRPARTRRHLAVAGVAAALLVVVGAVAIAARAPDPSATERADAPGPDDLFPVLGGGPADGDGETSATYVPAAEGGPGASAQAVLGRSAGDEVTDLVMLQVPVTDQTVPDLVGGVAATVAGRPALVEETAALTYLGFETDPPLLATGGDGTVALLDEFGPDDLVPGLDADGRPTLTIGSPPPGVEVLVAPTSSPAEDLRSLTVAEPAAAPGVDQVWVRTSSDAPLSGVAYAGSARRVAVGGTTGWASEADGGATVAWRAANGVTVNVAATRGTIADAVAVADTVRLVDKATWLATYVDTDASTDTTMATATPASGQATTAPPTGVGGGEGATTTTTAEATGDPIEGATTTTQAAAGDAAMDLVGRPAPDLVGTPVDGSPPAGTWRVVAYGATWCVPCAADLDVLAELAPNRPDVTIVLVFVGDDVAAVEDLLDGHEVTDRPVWAIAAPAADDPPGVPSALIVDPDGIVRDVVVGGLDTAALDDRLADLMADG